MKYKIGKTKIEIKVEGCHDCGTLWSSGWVPLKTTSISINNREIDIRIPLCRDCLDRRTNPNPLQITIFEIGERK